MPNPLKVTIKLQIDTGGGNYPIIASVGTIAPTWTSLLGIALGGQTIDSFDARLAGEIIGDLDRAIDSLQNRRQDYFGLQDGGGNTFRYLRPKVLQFFIKFRDLCRLHPNCKVFLYGWLEAAAGL